jgi:hypothetical protein
MCVLFGCALFALNVTCAHAPSPLPYYVIVTLARCHITVLQIVLARAHATGIVAELSYRDCPSGIQLYTRT